MKQRNLNFRQTRSERSASASYQNYGRYLKEKFYKVIFKKYGKN